MTRSKLLILLAVIALVALPAFAGKSIENTDGTLDGVWKVSQAKNKTKDQVYKDLEVDIDGKYATLRINAENRRIALKCDEWYDWGYMIELTAREKETGDLWIIKYKGSNRQPGQ